MILPSRTLTALCAIGAMVIPSSAFTNLQPKFASSSTALSASKSYLEKGDRVLLVGPGFLQLNIAKAAKAAGLVPIVVAPQKKLDAFKGFVNDKEIMNEAEIGIPDEKGTVAGVVFCSEEAVYGKEIIKTLMESDGTYVDPEGPSRTIACIPISNAVKKEKSMGWMPIFNNDNKEKQIWSDFTNAFQTHPISGSSRGSVVRVGNLFGGSIDGPKSLEPLGLDECIYKVCLLESVCYETIFH